MKSFILSLLLLLCAVTVPAQLIKDSTPVDTKYLAGAVPEVDGKVTFSHTFDVSKMGTADSLHHYLLRWIGMYYNHENVLKRQNIVTDSLNHRIEVGIVEYLVFKSNALVLDRSQIIYSLKLSQKGNKLSVQMSQISYYYEEERSPEKYTAEEWITDSQSLNKKGTKILFGRKKFRIQTIDKFNDICENLEVFLNRLK